MILEHAVITVPAGKESDFETAFVQGKKVLEASPGCRSVRLRRGIEEPRRYLLLVEWEQLSDHTVDFRESPRFAEWRAFVGPFFDGPPTVDHYEEIAAG